MVKNIILSAVFIFISLSMLKFGVDSCLPYRSSAIFPLLSERENFVCQTLSNWDDSARRRRTQIFEVLQVHMSQLDKDAINPSVLGWGDLLLFWRIPLILPLILEQVPEYTISSFKLVFFAISATIFLALIFHYLSLIYKSFTELISPPRGGGPGRSAREEQVATLMGRSDASNSIVMSKGHNKE